MNRAQEPSKDILQGSIAVIMGGGGIGMACAVLLAERGATCVLGGRDIARLTQFAATLSGSGHRAVEAELCDSGSLAAMAAQVQSLFRTTDILINAGGFTKAIAHDDLNALEDAFIDEMFRTNWRGMFATIRAFAPMLKQSGNGFVANISSIAAVTGVGSNIAYCAVKAGTDSMTQTLARVLAPEVRVVGFSPGVVDTDFVPGRDQDWKARQAATSPLRHLVTPDDVARAILGAILYLPATTGSIIQVDAGRHL